MQQALGLPAQPPDRRPLVEIASAQGRTPAAVIQELELMLNPAATPTRGSPTSLPGAP